MYRLVGLEAIYDPEGKINLSAGRPATIYHAGSGNTAIAKLLPPELGEAIVAQRIGTIILLVYTPSSIEDIVRGYVYKK